MLYIFCAWILRMYNDKLLPIDNNKAPLAHGRSAPHEQFWPMTTAGNEVLDCYGW